MCQLSHSTRTGHTRTLELCIQKSRAYNVELREHTRDQLELCCVLALWAKCGSHGCIKYPSAYRSTSFWKSFGSAKILEHTLQSLEFSRNVIWSSKCAWPLAMLGVTEIAADLQADVCAHHVCEGLRISVLSAICEGAPATRNIMENTFEFYVRTACTAFFLESNLPEVLHRGVPRFE